MAEPNLKFDCPEDLQRQNNDADVEEDQERDEINNDADVEEDQGRDEIKEDQRCDEIKQDPKFDCPKDLQRQINDDVAVCRYDPHGVMNYYYIEAEGTYKFPLTIQRYASLRITIQNNEHYHYTRHCFWRGRHIYIPRRTRRILIIQMSDCNIAYEQLCFAFLKENGK